MVLFINPAFWIIAAAVYLLLLFETPRRATLRFGLFNIAALAILLGWKVAAAVFLFVLLFWGVLYRLRLWLRGSHWKADTGAGFALILMLALVFWVHKLNLEDGAFVSRFSQAAPWARPDLLLPFLAMLSFSYIFVRSVELVHCVIWKRMPLLDPVSLAGYLVPFHMLVAGPVNIYSEHLEMDPSPPRAPNSSQVLIVLNEITTGLFYKFVIAEGIRIYFYGLEGHFTVASLFDSGVLVVYTFFDFAGYSRVARGIGRLFGVPTPENFSAPFRSTSVTDFWTRWHISMGLFVRRNLFTPLQLQLVRKVGIRRAAWASVLTMIVSFGFVGLWHRLSWTWFLWGALMGLLMAAEKTAQGYFLKWGWNQSPRAQFCLRILGPVYVFSVVIVSAYFVANEIFPA